MAIDTPAQLVNEFKKSGEFERLRQELLRKLMDGQGMDLLKKGVSDAARQELARVPKLSFMSSDAIYKEIVDNIDRFPVVDRVVRHSLSDPSFTENIRNSVQKILLEHKEQKVPMPGANESSIITSATSSTNRPSVETVTGLPIVVTPAKTFPEVSEVSNTTVPPPIPTRSLAQDSEALETGKSTVSTDNLTDGNSKTGTLTTTGTDVEMSDETQP